MIAGVASIVKWHHDLGAERLGQLDLAGDHPVGRTVGLERCVLEVLGPDAEDHGAALVVLQRPGARSTRLVAERDPLAAGDCGEAAVVALQLRLDEVHRRAADEAADEEVHRAVVELLRIGDLLQLALAHHGDAVAHRHRLDLVVGDVDGRRSEVRSGAS